MSWNCPQAAVLLETAVAHLYGLTSGVELCPGEFIVEKGKNKNAIKILSIFSIMPYINSNFISKNNGAKLDCPNIPAFQQGYPRLRLRKVVTKYITE